jgi:Uncharacterised methyltransferase family (DUF6094)
MHVAFGTLALGTSQTHHPVAKLWFVSAAWRWSFSNWRPRAQCRSYQTRLLSIAAAEGLRLRKLLVFEEGASAADPCDGTGAALHQLTEGADVDKHGVELDAGRAASASASGIATVHGNVFDTIGKSESFSFLYLNPPYDCEIGCANSKRMEYLFLDNTFRWLIEGGVLLRVVPQERLDSAIPLLPGTSLGCVSSG